MSDFIIGIHGITNEMVADAPSPDQVFPKFHAFLGDSVAVAHHAAFDLGFMSLEFETRHLRFPLHPGICSSLLSRKLFPMSPNHKLQTLVEFFKIPKGQAHRALDDTKACLEVALRCFEKFGWDRSLEELIKFQESRMEWQRFSLTDLENTDIGQALVTSIRREKDMEMSYRSGNDKRVVKPIGIVRNPQGDYLVAYEGEDRTQHKRFYLDKIKFARRLD